MSRPLNLVVAGATGAVGRTVLEVLEEREVAVGRLRALASQRSAGADLAFRDGDVKVEALQEGAFRGFDVAILALPADVAKAWASRARAEGCLVVDASAAFRMDADVPLVAVDANGAAARPGASGVIASPGATALHLATALAPLHAAAGLERVVATALQCASAAGRRGVEQLEREAHALMNGVDPGAASGAIPHRLAFNLVPQAGGFGPSGYAEEELRVAAELKRLLGALELPVSATVIRVPTFHGHLATVNVRLRRSLPATEARQLLRRAAGVKLLDEPGAGVYPMPMLAVNDDAVHVGRVRDDLSGPNGLELVVAGDNLRTGAATNLVRLAERLAASRAS
jgi:aspartate-semialdehyde dehydrogenase